MDLAAYEEQILRLLPRGLVWEGPKFRALVSSFAREISRISDAIDGTDGLIVEVIPTTADAMLPDYEKLVGLPYPGFNLAGTISERQLDVAQALIAQGGQSNAYFLQIVAAHGHVGATITDGFHPFRCGDRCGLRLYGIAWAFFWVVTMEEAGPDALLEYLCERFKPAHTTVQFIYLG